MVSPGLQILIVFLLVTFTNSQTCTTENEDLCQKTNGWQGAVQFMKDLFDDYDEGSGDKNRKDPFDQVAGGPEMNIDLFQRVSALFKRQEGSDRSLEEDFVSNVVTAFSSPQQEKSVSEVLDMFQESMQVIQDQMKKAFGDIFDDLKDRLSLWQVLYYFQHEESVKNAVWKRKSHRFLTKLPVSEAIQLGDGLFLSHLAYADSCDVIFQQLRKFDGGSFLLRNCTTDSHPNQPAHFLAVQRVSRKRGPLETVVDNIVRSLDGEPGNIFAGQALEVVLVVRGTKHLADILSDAMLSATEYRGGKAHDGILKSARWMAETYREDLHQLLQVSGLERMKLWIFGHSLGAGTAALTAIELDALQLEWLTARSLGFGTPSLVSRDLSEKAQDVVTTVVNDADVIPRMSGASIKNAWLRVMQHNWTVAALSDFDQVVGTLKSAFHDSPLAGGWLEGVAKDARQWLEQWFDQSVGPILKSLPIRKWEEAELIPPGDCIHLFRDGTSWQGTYINCTFFQDLELVRHLVDDHLIPPGYYTGLLSYLREQLGNFSWKFEHDLLEIPMS